MSTYVQAMLNAELVEGMNANEMSWCFIKVRKLIHSGTGSGTEKSKRTSKHWSQPFFNVTKTPNLLQDTVAGGFWPSISTHELNANNQSAPLFSKLESIRTMRGCDGKYHFKLCYAGEMLT